jgi:hypothetical protein
MQLLIQIALLVLILTAIAHFPEWWRSWRSGSSRRLNPPQKPPISKPNRQQQAIFQKYTKWVDEVNALLPTQAEERAVREIRTGRHWQAVTAANTPLPEGIPRTVRRLVEQFGGVAETSGGARICIEAPKPTEGPAADVLKFGSPETAVQQWWTIGTDPDNDPILISSASDTIHIVRRSSISTAGRWSGTYPSVWHYILVRSFKERA